MNNNYSHFMFRRFLIAIFFLIFPLLISSLQAQLPNWRYEIPTVIHNNTSNPLIGYQVLLRVNTQALISAGHMQADGRDIRFAKDCSGSALLNHYLDAYINTDSTKIWVKADTIAANDSVRIYLYFGNPAATSASTLSVFNGPHSSTDSVTVTTTNTVSLCQRGFRFAPTQDLFVTQFGNRTPNGTQRYVTLFNYNTQAIVYQSQVAAGTSGSWHYDALTQPFWVQTGTQYLLELFNGSGDLYYYGTSSQIGQHLTYYDMRYCNSCTQNTFPTLVLSNFHYGTPDLLYYTKQSVTPEPTSNYGLEADTTTPAAPQNLDAVDGTLQVSLHWPANSEFDLSHYNIFRNLINDPNTALMIASVNVPDTTYIDTVVVINLEYFYWLTAVDRFCSPRQSAFSLPDSATPGAIGIQGNEGQIPKVFALYQNYPNPFNPVTTINYDVPRNASVRILIYDVLGEQVAEVINENRKPGRYAFKWNAANYASGVYIYKMEAFSPSDKLLPFFTDTKKMVILK